MREPNLNAGLPASITQGIDPVVTREIIPSRRIVEVVICGFALP